MPDPTDTDRAQARALLLAQLQKHGHAYMLFQHDVDELAHAFAVARLEGAKAGKMAAAKIACMWCREGFWHAETECAAREIHALDPAACLRASAPGGV